jgi:hypothetical protein
MIALEKVEESEAVASLKRKLAIEVAEIFLQTSFKKSRLTAGIDVCIACKKEY